jgi:hypothetical protein
MRLRASSAHKPASYIAGQRILIPSQGAAYRTHNRSLPVKLFMHVSRVIEYVLHRAGRRHPAAMMTLTATGLSV